MLRSGPIAIFCLVLVAGCGDLTRIPSPPVPLSAISASAPGQQEDGDETTSPTGALRLLKAVAPGSLVTIHLPDIGGTLRRFKKTSLYRFFTAPAVKSFLGPVSINLAMIEGAGSTAEGERLLRAMRGAAVLAIEDIELDPAGKPTGIRLVAAVTVGGAVREAEKLLELVGMMAASAKGNRVEKGTLGHTPFTRIVVKQPQPMIIEFAIYQDALIFGIGRETATAAVTRLQTRGSDSLVDSPAFRSAMERCAGPHDAVRIHIDLNAVMSRFSSLVPEDVMHFLRVADLHKFRSATIVGRLEGKDIVLTSFFDSAGGKDFISSLLAANPVDRQFLSRIPGDATSFSLFAIDGPRILEHLRKSLRSEFVEKIEKGLAKMRKAGLDLEKDILRVFGPRCALVTLPHGEPDASGLDLIWNHILGTALIVDVRDPARARATLTKLPMADDSLRRRAYKVGGVDVVSYRVDVAQLPDELSPSYAYIDDFLLIAMCDRTMKRMLEPGSKETAARFRELLKDAPATVATLGYDNTGEGLGLMFGAIMTSLSRAQGDPASRSGVPPSAIRELTRDWNPTVSWTVADERGILMFTRSPTAGFGGMGGLTGLFILSSIAIPNFTVARRHTNENAALATLLDIHSAQQTFRANGVRDEDNDDEGEYGFIVELLGRRRPGDRRTRRMAPLVTGLAKQGRTYVSKGYYYRVYLPAEDGAPIGGHEKTSRLKQVDGDLAEAVMVVVAWPSSTSAGSRAFLMSASGTIHACEGAYVGKQAPPPDVLNQQRGNLASQVVSAKKARDGRTWVRVKD